MKQILFLVMISCTVMVVLSGLPKDCHSVCPMNYEPVCAVELGEAQKTFSNECVMRNYNCENNKNLSVISNTECPGGGGARMP